MGAQHVTWRVRLLVLAVCLLTTVACSTSARPASQPRGTAVDPSWLAADNNLVWGSFDPITAGASPSPKVGTVRGSLTLQRVQLRKAATLTNILFGLAGVDRAGRLSHSFLGIYDSTGRLVASTADLSTSLRTSPGPVTKPFTLPYAAAPGEYFIALLLNGTWKHSLAFKSAGGGGSANSGLAVPHLRMSNLLRGLTALPPNIALTDQKTNLITGGWGSTWYGLS